MLKAIVCGFVAMGSAFGMDWKTIEIGGIRYVPLAQVADFYRLENPEATGDGVILKNREITLNFEADSREASFNKVGFLLERELQKKEEAYYLSVNDLNDLLEPVLRPQNVQGLAGFDTVVLDLDFPSALPGREFLIRELKLNFQRKGFKVVVFGDRKDARLDWAKFRKESGDDRPVLIHFAMRDGERMSLKSEAIGASPRPGLAMATGVHWAILAQLGRHVGLARLEDERISVGRGERFQGVDVPACRLTIAYDFSRKFTVEKFHQTIARSVSEAVSFARKAGQTR